MMPSRGPGRPRAILAKVNDNIAKRKQLGPLRALVIQPRTANRYTSVLAVFFAWVAACTTGLPEATEEIDDFAASFVEYLWESGDGRGQACDSLCALQWRIPLLRGKLQTSWALCKAWSRLELPIQSPAPDSVTFLRFCWGATFVG